MNNRNNTNTVDTENESEQENLKLGFAGKLAKIFVVNSKLSMLLLLTMFVWGILSFFITPKQYNPQTIQS